MAVIMSSTILFSLNLAKRTGTAWMAKSWKEARSPFANNPIALIAF